MPENREKKINILKELSFFRKSDPPGAAPLSSGHQAELAKLMKYRRCVFAETKRIQKKHNSIFWASEQLWANAHENSTIGVAQCVIVGNLWLFGKSAFGRKTVLQREGAGRIRENVA